VTEAIVAAGAAPPEAAAWVGRCTLTVAKPALKAPLVSRLETKVP
jgi:hypothetical protein